MGRLRRLRVLEKFSDREDRDATKRSSRARSGGRTGLPFIGASQCCTGGASDYNQRDGQPGRIGVGDEHSDPCCRDERRKKSKSLPSEGATAGGSPGGRGVSALATSGYHSLKENANSMAAIGIIHAVQKLSG